MLPLLLKVPESDSDWQTYSFNLRDEIRRCNDAIRTQKGVNLTDVDLDPINWNHIFDWLFRVSQAIGVICEVTGTASQDIFNVDLKDSNARVGWVYTIWQELSAAETALGI